MKTITMLVLVLILVAGIAVNGLRAQLLPDGLPLTPIVSADPSALDELHCDRSLGLRPATCRSPRPPYVFDGETLFKGLFFGQGPVATRFPEIASRFPRMSMTEGDKAFAQFIEWVSDRLRQYDRLFFDRLAAGLQSGNHLTIAATMDQAARIVEKVLQEEAGQLQRILVAQGLESDILIAGGGTVGGGTVGGGTVDGTVTSEGVYLVRDLIVFAERAVVLFTAAVYDTAVVFQHNRFWGQGGSASSDLQRELWVNLLAQRLPQVKADESSLFPTARTTQWPRIFVAQVEGGAEIIPPGPPDPPGTIRSGDTILDQNLSLDTNLIYWPFPFLDHNMAQLLPVVLPFPPVLNW